MSGVSGTASRNPNTVDPGNIRILGGISLFSASVGFRGLPMGPYMSDAGYGIPHPHTVFPGDMRILGGRVLVLSSLSIRELPFSSGLSIYVGASGTETQSANTAFPGYMRILGVGYF